MRRKVRLRSSAAVVVLFVPYVPNKTETPPPATRGVTGGSPSDS